jgi:hypothetical protein
VICVPQTPTLALPTRGRGHVVSGLLVSSHHVLSGPLPLVGRARVGGFAMLPPKRRKARRLLRGIHAFPLCSESDYRDTVLALVSSFQRHGVSFGSASEAHLPSPFRIRTFAFAGARSLLRCLVCLARGGLAFQGLGRRRLLAFLPCGISVRTAPVPVLAHTAFLASLTGLSGLDRRVSDRAPVTA